MKKLDFKKHIIEKAKELMENWNSQSSMNCDDCNVKDLNINFVTDEGYASTAAVVKINVAGDDHLSVNAIDLNNGMEFQMEINDSENLEKISDYLAAVDDFFSEVAYESLPF